jgi:hypothetical protein
LSIATLHFLDNASATKRVASVSRFVLHASIHFLGFEDLLAVNKSNIHSLADRVWVFALQGENVSQESFNARIGHGRHHSPRSRIISLRYAPYSTCRTLLLRDRAKNKRFIDNIE